MLRFLRNFWAALTWVNDKDEPAESLGRLKPNESVSIFDKDQR